MFSRGQQVVRVWRLIRLIEGRGRTVAELAGALGCSTRTVLRDLAAIEEAGFPLYDERDGRAVRWRFVEGFKARLPVPLTEEELGALALGERLARRLARTAAGPALASAAAKLAALIPQPYAEPFEQFRAAIGVREPPPKVGNSPRDLIKVLLRAITGRETLKVLHHSFSRGMRTERRLDPYHLWWYEGGLYLAAYCHDRDDVRTFAVERIGKVTLTEDRFPSPGFDLDAYLKDSLGIYRGKTISLRVRFRREVAPWIRERRWHESQKFGDAPGGEVILSLQVADTVELRRWLLSFGSAALVLEPPDLREAIRAEAEALLRSMDVEEFLAAQLPLPLLGVPRLALD